MKPPPPVIPFRFTSLQRKGLLALVAIIVCIQGGVLFCSHYTAPAVLQPAAARAWLSHEGELIALTKKGNTATQKQQPFNPNFISDFKGYALGLSPAQLSRLKAYRAKGKWVNSAQDFKDVTGVPDSVLAVLSPYFKFPDWATAKKQRGALPSYANTHTPKETSRYTSYTKGAVAVVQQDINAVTQEQLEKAYGIGPAYARKIIYRRNQLGAFVSMEQLDEFTEFSAEAVVDLKKRFTVVSGAGIIKLNINTASLNQLSRFPYFNRDIARSIITARSMDGKIHNFDELIKIEPKILGKLKIISLYLEY